MDLKISPGKELLKSDVDLKNQIKFIYMKKKTTKNLKLNEDA